MPACPRPSSKAKKIAYSILGTPINMGNKKKSRYNKQLIFEETSRVR